MPGWTSYTPSWTGTGGTPTLGNGTLTGSYLSLGSLVIVRIAFTWGSTSSAAGITGWRFSLPVAPATGWILNGNVVDSGTALMPAILSDFSGSTAVLRAWNGTTYATCSTSAPMTWANGDNFIINGVYSV